MITKKCSQCGKEFILNDGEIAFYKKKRLHLPNRCKECRDANKLKHNKENQIRIENEMEASLNPRDRIHVVKDESNAILSEETVSSVMNRPMDAMKRKRKFIKFAIVFLVLWTIGVVGLNYFRSKASEQKQEDQSDSVSYTFKSNDLFAEHYNKHAGEFPYTSQEDYLAGANAVILDKNSLHKQEAEDGDEIYYSEEKNEIVFVSSEHFIRTYFKPDNGKAYFDKQ